MASVLDGVDQELLGCTLRTYDPLHEEVSLSHVRLIAARSINIIAGVEGSRINAELSCRSTSTSLE